MRPFHRKLFYLLSFLIPTQLAAHFWPEWSSILGRRIDYLSPAVYLTDIVMVVLCIHFGYSFRKELAASLAKHKIILIALCILIVCNIISANSWEVSLWRWIKYIGIGMVCWYIHESKPDERLLRLSLLGGMSISIALALTQLVLQKSVGSVFWFLGERTFTIDTPGIARTTIGVITGNELTNGKLFLRPYGTFPHPNVLGGISATLLPLFLMPDKTLSRSIRLLGILILFTGILVSFSRSAMIVGLLLLFGYQCRHTIHRILNRVPRVVNLGVLSVLFLTLTTLPYWLHVGESTVKRADLIGASVLIIKTHPIFGVGLGNFLSVLPAHMNSKDVYFLQPVHNIFLLLQSEIGVILWFFIGIVWILINKQHSPTLLSPWKISLVAILLLGTLDHYPVTLQQGLLILSIYLGQSFSTVHQKTTVNS